MFDHTEYSDVRERMMESLDNYAKKGWVPGGFLEAVLRNDLSGAMMRADHVSRNNIFHIVKYCYNELPSECWGSKEHFAAWLEEEKYKTFQEREKMNEYTESNS